MRATFYWADAKLCLSRSLIHTVVVLLLPITDRTFNRTLARKRWKHFSTITPSVIFNVVFPLRKFVRLRDLNMKGQNGNIRWWRRRRVISKLIITISLHCKEPWVQFYLLFQVKNALKKTSSVSGEVHQCFDRSRVTGGRLNPLTLGRRTSH